VSEPTRPYTARPSTASAWSAVDECTKQLDFLSSQEGDRW